METFCALLFMLNVEGRSGLEKFLTEKPDHDVISDVIIPNIIFEKHFTKIISGARNTINSGGRNKITVKKSVLYLIFLG